MDEGYVEKALEKGISLHRGPAGESGRGSFTRDFERWMKGILKVERLSARAFCVGNLEWGVLYWGYRKVCRKGSGDGHLSP